MPPNLHFEAPKMLFSLTQPKIFERIIFAGIFTRLEIRPGYKNQV